MRVKSEFVGKSFRFKVKIEKGISILRKIISIQIFFAPTIALVNNH